MGSSTSSTLVVSERVGQGDDTLTTIRCLATILTNYSRKLLRDETSLFPHHKLHPPPRKTVSREFAMV